MTINLFWRKKLTTKLRFWGLAADQAVDLYIVIFNNMSSSHSVRSRNKKETGRVLTMTAVGKKYGQ